MIEIAIDPKFLPSYDTLPSNVRKKLQKQITLLKENPRHPSLNVHKIQGTDYWEFYVDKSYRCVFKQDGNLYSLYKVGHHDVIEGVG